MMWYVIMLIDMITKFFSYAWFVICPILFIIFILFIKKKSIKNELFYDSGKVFKINLKITALIAILFISFCTVRLWGPTFYKGVIGMFICGRENDVEYLLEKKYDKNFTFISKSKIVTDEFAADTLGQDVNNDYHVNYVFKDDDGVYAIVEYKKNIKFDWYESKRSKYQLENTIYEYAKKNNFNKRFYVYVESTYELINYSDLTMSASKTAKSYKEYHDRIIFIVTEENDEYKNMIKSALKNTLGLGNMYVQEYIVSEEEYKKAVSFYEDNNKMAGIADEDYDDSYLFSNDSKMTYYYLR